MAADAELENAVHKHIILPLSLLVDDFKNKCFIYQVLFMFIYFLKQFVHFQIHPKRTYFAVGEKGNCPNINIFEYPSLKLYRMLRAGTEKSLCIP